MKKYIFLLSIIVCIFIGCGSIEYQPEWIDSPETRDPSLSDPNYRVSTRSLPPGTAKFNRPVIIAVHRFTACTYEWEEFREYAEKNSNVLVSLVLLGGHGTDIEDFKQATWQDWQQPIIDEYNALKQAGYKNISFAGSSTGATLILEALMSGKITAASVLKQIFFIDPFIIPTDKNLYCIDLAGIFIANVPNEGGSPEEKKHWYVNRPSSSLIQLKKVAQKVEKELKRGYILPDGVKLTVYKVKTDDAADPESALFIEKNIRDAGGNKPEVYLLDSDKHVFTRLKGRAEVTEEDKRLQLKTFAEILEKIRYR
ncbi:MAG: hypothetical protein JW822_07430 [Spirochaetales bacterium]|nr:hypothetical protein [Spirochaetales bacterium]